MRTRFSTRQLAALFFLLIMLADVLTPTVAYALTAGPSSPEASSFEPVDTTDLVNLATGDFTYNIPLLEVPGPAGSYPLSLSYHGGIMPGEEASWVGLGWTLNPGAITRSVNGFPDDFQNVDSYDRLYWSGGKTDTYSIGVTVGLRGLASASAGLQVSHDTYEGVGVGGYVSLGLLFDNKTTSGMGINAGFNLTVGVSPYGGGPYVSSGFSVGLRKTEQSAGSLGLSAGVSSSSGAYAGAGISISGQSLLGASISSLGGHAELAGTSASTRQGVSNSKSGKISTSQTSVDFDIPIIPGVLSFSFGHSQYRYWMDETEHVNINGSLFTPQSVVTSFDTNAYDSYTLPVSSSGTDPNKGLGPSFLNFDSYNVSAQGLAGNIRPYAFQNLAFRQNRKMHDKPYEIKQFPYQAADYRSGTIQFRFIGDFSNRYLIAGDSWSSGVAPLTVNSGSVTSGENGTDGKTGGLLFGSRAIEWYTNQQMLAGTAGLLECAVPGFERSDDPANQIGGFRITNESGVTYHFNLPVYAYDEYQYSENTERGNYFNEFKKQGKYAYTWLLTAITGPDFVDRGGNNNTPNQKLDKNDWGYWISFEYGRWTEDYAWRNPEVGFENDLDNKFRNYASGKKEIYYLDAVHSKNYTALFIKSVRVDAKSSVFAKELQKKSDLGFIPGNYAESNSTSQRLFNNNDHPECTLDGIDFRSTNTTYVHKTYPVSSLQLSRVILIESSQMSSIGVELAGLRSSGGLLDFSVPISKRVKTEDNFKECQYVQDDNGFYDCDCYQSKNLVSDISSNILKRLHESNNILDQSDVSSAVLEQLRIKSSRSIDFTYSNELVPETINSFDHPSLYTTNPSMDASSYSLQGKLTLKSVSFFGKSGANSVPPIRFDYELENPKTGSAILQIDGSAYRFSANTDLIKGDLIHFLSGGRKCYGLVYDKTDSDHRVKIVGRNNPVGGSINWTTTKNPPFRAGGHDMWGHYKPDFEPNTVDDISRVTTAISAPSSDVWSLRSIKTSYGSTIRVEYEPDTYTKNVFQKVHSFVVRSISQLSCQQSSSGNPRGPDQDPDVINRNPPVGIPENINCTYRLGIHNEGIDLRELYQPGEFVNCILPYKYGYIDEFTNQSRVVVDDASLITVTNVGEDFIEGTVAVKPNSYLYGATIQYYFNKNFAFKGGYRVKSIEVEDNLTHRSSKTSYDYNHAGTSSGVTSFEPDVLDKIMLLRADADIEKYAQSRMGQITDAVVKLTRELPSPGVIYQYVTVTETVDGETGQMEFASKALYEFEVPNPNMIFLSESSFSDTYSNPPYQGQAYQILRKRNVEIHNLTGSVGKLKRIVLLDPQGVKLSETTYGYLHDLLNFNQTSPIQIANQYNTLLQPFSHQGIVHETIWDGRFVKRDNSEVYDLFGITGKKISYPTVPISERSVNYKSGLVLETQNLSFDFYSGAVTRRLSSDGLGNFFLEETVPAYRKYPGMGLAPLGGRNMLTQEAQTTTYKVVSSTDHTPNSVVSSAIQIWSDQIPVLGSGSLGTTGPQSGVWRKKSNYVFIGNSEQAMAANGLIAASSFTPFTNWTTGEPPSQWQKTSEVTLYDPNSHAIEAKDGNGNFAATKFSNNHALVLATAANAEYREIAYSGAEEQPVLDQFNMLAFGGGVYCLGNWVQEAAHTGKSSVRQEPNAPAFKYFFVPKQKTYVTSVWSDQPLIKIKYRFDNASNPIQLANVKRTGKAGNWYLHEAEIAVVGPQDRLEIWCEAGGTDAGYFDDFRVHPLTGPMTSYVYNSFGELSHILDASNLFTEFRYDAMGRLTQTYRETLLGPGDQPRYGVNGIAKVSDIQYNYGKNSPYQVNLTVSQTGGSGSVSPIGSVPVEQGETQIIRIQESCAAPQVRWVYVDNIQYPTNASFTLFDGCSVSITPGSVRLANVRAPHEIRVDFNTYMSDAGYRCHMVNVGGGQQCPSGLFEYGTRDQCGNITWVQSSWRGPGNAPNCCDLQPSGSNCHCGQVEN